MRTYIIDPRNTTKPYNFGFFKALNRKKYPFVFLGYVPESWGRDSPVKENNLFLPFSRGIFENKNTQRFIANLTQPIEMFFGYLRLRARLENKDILHFLWFTAPSMEQYLIPEISNYRLLHTAHNLLPHREWESDFEKFRSLYSLMECVIVHDRESRDRFNNIFNIKTPIEVIPHGNLEDFYNTFDRTDDKESKMFWSYHLNKLKRPIFLFMGPIKTYKGFEVLHKAINILNNLNYDFSVVIKDSQDKYAKNLHYLPVELTYNKLGLIYRNADVVILPHTKISQSVTLFEAGYFEKPVIVSSIGGFRETVRDRVDGFLFEKGDPGSLAKKMEKFIHSREDAISMGTDFKQHLIKHYSWNRIVEKWIRLYQRDSYP